MVFTAAHGKEMLRPRYVAFRQRPPHDLLFLPVVQCLRENLENDELRCIQQLQPPTQRARPGTSQRAYHRRRPWPRLRKRLEVADELQQNVWKNRGWYLACAGVSPQLG